MCKNAVNSDFSELQQQMMRQALQQALEAARQNEVPVGAVIYTAQGEVVSAARNQTVTQQNSCAHAEILALQQANAAYKNYRLPALRMAVTLEPCAMCLGAVFCARLAQLTFAAADEKSGACGSVVNLAQHRSLNHHTAVTGGLMAAEAAQLLRDFFHQRR